jgi:hypothetical protein
LLEAFVAINGTSRQGNERHLGFSSALRAGDRGIEPSMRPTASLPAHSLFPVRLAGLAALRLILEVLSGIEELFPRREDEIGSAFNALQHAVGEVSHGTHSTKQSQPLVGNMNTDEVAHYKRGGACARRPPTHGKIPLTQTGRGTSLAPPAGPTPIPVCFSCDFACERARL